MTSNALPNPFVALAKWAPHTVENFSTTALWTVLARLKVDEAEVFETILRRLFGFDRRAHDVQIRTQVRWDSGIPDILLESSKGSCLIEAKVDADLGPQQLQRYKQELAQRGGGQLLLLTKTRIDDEGLADRRLLWHDVYMEFRQVLPRTDSEPSKSMLTWMTDYLEATDLTREPVTYSLGTGLPHYRRLMDYLLQSLKAHGVQMSKKRLNSTGDWTGYLVEAQYSLGIDYPQVFVIRFARLKAGGQEPQPLDLMACRFFDQSPARQATLLHDWLGQRLKEAGLANFANKAPTLDAPIAFEMGQASRDFRRLFEYLREVLSAAGYPMAKKRINLYAEGISWLLDKKGVALDFANPWTLTFWVEGKPASASSFDLRAAKFFDVELADQLSLLAKWLKEAQAKGFPKP